MQEDITTQKAGFKWSSPGCREHTHAGQCFQMHSGHSCQLRRTAGVPGVAHGRIGRPESRDSRSTPNKATINKREIKFICMQLPGMSTI